MKAPREIEVEVLPKETAPRTPTGSGEDPFIALIARLMDTAFTVPGTKIRFGLDPLLGLLPGLGDTASAAVSVVLILKSARYGVPKIVLARMAMNVLLNTAVGAIPVVGDLFSVWFKSNAQNYDLLRRHAHATRKSSRADWVFVIGLVAGIMLLVVLLVLGAATLLKALLGAG